MTDEREARLEMFYASVEDEPRSGLNRSPVRVTMSVERVDGTDPSGNDRMTRLCEFALEAEPGRAMETYQAALAALVKPDVLIVVREGDEVFP